MMKDTRGVKSKCKLMQISLMHFRPSPADVPPLSRAQDVRLAQPDPAAPEDGPQLDGRHDVAQQPRDGGRAHVGRP